MLNHLVRTTVKKLVLPEQRLYGFRRRSNVANSAAGGVLTSFPSTAVTASLPSSRISSDSTLTGALERDFSRVRFFGTTMSPNKFTYPKARRDETAVDVYHDVEVRIW